ncbi:MAG: tetratricopeptide repeat protein [Candidatus Obscuribacterales bacterium]|nr:tetratricopeptide repeat protein [Candidatus Obscuribacterales bacterium]
MEQSVEVKGSDIVLAAARNSYERGDIISSIHLYLQAVDLIECKLGSSHLRLAQPLMRLGNLYEQSGNNSDAEHFFKRAAEVLARNCAERTHPDSMKLYTVE